MTERLFDADAYISEFDAVVLACEEKNGAFETVLDRTAFFPEGGGQDSDIGTINGEPVIHVSDIKGEIRHLCGKKFETGKTVHGKIDFKERFRRMQNHTGEHILSGVAHKEFGVENVGFHLSEKYIRIDYDKFLTGDDVRYIEYLANEKIWRNLSVTAYYPSREELDKITYRSKKEIDGALRLVVIDVTDVCACCAPHVANTGEVGCIKIVSCTKYKGGCRIEAVCGSDAYELFEKEHAMLCNMSRSIGAKAEALPDFLEKSMRENANLKHSLTNAEKALMMHNLDKIGKSDGNFCFFFESAEVSVMREFLNEAVKRCDGICAAFSGNDADGYKFIAASEKINLKDKCKIISDAISAKCGGSPVMIQGSSAAKRSVIVEFFENISV